MAGRLPTWERRTSVIRSNRAVERKVTAQSAEGRSRPGVEEPDARIGLGLATLEGDELTASSLASASSLSSARLPASIFLAR